jgi:hypothetical protein
MIARECYLATVSPVRSSDHCLGRALRHPQARVSQLAARMAAVARVTAYSR